MSAKRRWKKTIERFMRVDLAALSKDDLCFWCHLLGISDKSRKAELLVRLQQFRAALRNKETSPCRSI
jgi:hypothetical protein